MHLFYGLAHLPLWGYIVVTVSSVQLTLLGITLYLHRERTLAGARAPANVPKLVGENPSRPAIC